MLFSGWRLVLGSRSPRRLELLRLLAGDAEIEVLQPRSSEEPGFDGLCDWPGVERQLAQIARAKSDDVIEQVRVREAGQGAAPLGAKSVGPLVIAADTIIVVREDGDRLLVLGQPPEGDGHESAVRAWFREHYFGRTHVAATAVSVATLDGRREERIVRTEVTFARDGEPWLDWYLETGEPRGKAGGYALQGAGSLFIERVSGSLSNVVGLPLRELGEMLRALDE